MRIHPNIIPRFNEDYSSNDFVSSMGSIFMSKSNLDEINKEIVYDYFGERHHYFTNNGRTSLYSILVSMNLPPGSNIGVPLYSCTAVFDSIILAGHLPYFIDINIDNYTICIDDLKEKVDFLSVLVVIHTFGFPADMDEILNIAKNIPIIEDCAHSLFSEYKGKLTGTIGDASFFSLKKYLCVGSGGLVFFNSYEKIGNSTLDYLPHLKSHSFLSEIVHPLKTYTYSFLYHKPWFGFAGCLFGSYVSNKKQKNNVFTPLNVRRDALFLFGKKTPSLRSNINLQRKNSFLLIDGLIETSLLLPFEPRNTFCNYFLFPILFDSKRTRDECHKKLRAKNVDTAKLYSNTPSMSKSLYGYKGDCPNTEILADTNLLLPNYHTLNEQQINMIIKATKKVVD